MSEAALLSATPVPTALESPRFFSLSQRIGRLRYFVYTLGAMLAAGALLIFIYLLCFLLPPALGKLVGTACFILVKNVGVPLIVFVMSIRRLHDFNANGWWSLTVLFPFTTLVFLFIPGSKGENRYGKPLVANSPGLQFTAIALPIAVLALYLSLIRGGGTTANNEAPSAMPGKPLKSYGQ